jgi:hypothetical protein
MKHLILIKNMFLFNKTIIMHNTNEDHNNPIATKRKIKRKKKRKIVKKEKKKIKKI